MQPPPALGRGRRRSHGDRVSADLDPSWERAPPRGAAPGVPRSSCRGAWGPLPGGASGPGAPHPPLRAPRALSARPRAALHCSSHLSPDAMAATRLASLSRGGIREVRHGENVLELEQERFQPFKKGQEVGGFAGHGLGPGGGSLPSTAGRVCPSSGTGWLSPGGEGLALCARRPPGRLNPAAFKWSLFSFPVTQQEAGGKNSDPASLEPGRKQP